MMAKAIRCKDCKLHRIVIGPCGKDDREELFETYEREAPGDLCRCPDAYRPEAEGGHGP